MNLAERKKSLLIDHVDILRSAFIQTKQQHSFTIEAIVVLPDHLHTLWRLPENDADYPMRWRLIKSAFSRALPQTERISTSRRKKGERGMWQRRYWEHLIRDEIDFERHVDYIHFNPVEHGYVKSPVCWLHSSIHRYVRTGIIRSYWASNRDFDGCFGER